MKSANSTIPPGAGQSWDSSLRLLNAAKHIQIPPVVAGFDGFIDTLFLDQAWCAVRPSRLLAMPIKEKAGAG